MTMMLNFSVFLCFPYLTEGLCSRGCPGRGAAADGAVCQAVDAWRGARPLAAAPPASASVPPALHGRRPQYLSPVPGPQVLKLQQKVPP